MVEARALCRIINRDNQVPPHHICQILSLWSTGHSHARTDKEIPPNYCHKVGNTQFSKMFVGSVHKVNEFRYVTNFQKLLDSADGNCHYF